MRRNLFQTPILFLLSLLLYNGSNAQEYNNDDSTDEVEEPVYFESADNGMMRFFFDEHYFLVDKDCEFRSIERIGRYDVAKRNFEGQFSDYDSDGALLLEGHYQNGKKEGEFTAYFPNGMVNWTVRYEDGVPQGSWVYNYPDGLPMLEVAYRDSSAYVWNFWDTRRRQQVVNGEGRFEFPVKATGYNEYGYDYINYQGRIKKGKPDGVWSIFFRYADDNQQDYIGMERFGDGKFLRGYDELNGINYHQGSRLQIGPMSYFVQAEGMVSKKCTIDENQDFSRFILNKLESAFAPYDASELPATLIELEASVGRSGNLTGLEIHKGFPEEEINKLIAGVFRAIGYWIPSYADGEYIDDVLEISVQTSVDADTRKLGFNELRISRRDGR